MLVSERFFGTDAPVMVITETRKELLQAHERIDPHNPIRLDECWKVSTAGVHRLSQKGGDQ